MSGLFVTFNAKQEVKMWHFQSLAAVGLLLALLLLQGKVLFSCYHLFSVHSFHSLKGQKMLRLGMLLSLGGNKELIRSGNCLQLFFVIGLYSIQ